jgi:hypothetical protein
MHFDKSFFVTCIFTVASLLSSCRNINPALPYEDNSFDVVTCVVSIDYLIKPIEILKEVNAITVHFVCTLHRLMLTRIYFPTGSPSTQARRESHNITIQ